MNLKTLQKQKFWLLVCLIALFSAMSWQNATAQVCTAPPVGCASTNFSNYGFYSTNDAASLEYDNFVSSFHQTVVRSSDGTFKIWGEVMGVSGTSMSNVLTPTTINSTLYPTLTGTPLRASIGGNAQAVILTTTGLFAHGWTGRVLATTVKSTQIFNPITVSGGSAGGLPIGVTPADVKMLFATDSTLAITTCDGNAWVLSQSAPYRGNGATGASNVWSRITTDEPSNPFLQNVVAVRGNGKNSGLIALKSDNTVWVWGRNVVKGDGTTFAPRNRATQMTLPAGAIPKMVGATADGGFYVLATDGNLYSIGENSSLQLGDWSSTDRLVWVQPRYTNGGQVMNNIKWVSPNEHDGQFSSVSVINSNGTLYAWGDNSASMIGGPSANANVNPLIPSGLTAADDILATETGGHTLMVIKQATCNYGYVGHRQNGSIGDGSTANLVEASFTFNTATLQVCGVTTVNISTTASPNGPTGKYCKGSVIPITTTPSGGTLSVVGPGTLVGNNITVTGAGTVTVSYNATSGCAQPVTTTLTLETEVPAAPTASVTVQPSCSISTGTIVATTPVPAAGVTYTLTGIAPVVASVTQASATFSGLAPGTYSLTTTYNSASCTSEGTTLVVNAVPTSCLVAVTESGTVTSATGGTAISNVRSNDLINGVAATAANSTIAQNGTWPSGISLNTTTGAITVVAGTAPGVYPVTYQLCDLATPTPACTTVEDTVRVTAVVTPVTENGTISSSGGTAIANVRNNDLVNGNPATAANSTISQNGVWPAGISLNTATGAITVVAGTAPGRYPVTYQLCDLLVPVTCATVVDTVIVTCVPTSSSTSVSVCNNSLPYLWNGINRTAAGTYTFVTPNAAGCDSTAILILSVTTTAAPTVSTNCSGGVGNATVNATSPVGVGFTYSLDGGAFQSSPTFTGIADGAHQIIAKDASGCASSATNFSINCACSITNPLDDCDGDGDLNGTDPAPSDPCVYSSNQVIANVNLAWNALDCDGDGVTNGQELIDGTNPSDGCSYNPVSVTLTRSTAWNALDCDGDGRTNGKEITDGTNPLDPCNYTGTANTTPSTTWNNADCDGDGRTNGKEVTDGTNPLDPCSFAGAANATPSTTWNNADCDGDGRTNGKEVTDGTNPLDPCSFAGAANTTPSTTWNNADCDGDGVPNGQELIDGTNPNDGCSYNPANVTLPRSTTWNNADCDGDGRTNGKEVTDGINPLDPCSFAGAANTTPSTTWNSADCDGDGRTNGKEVTDGTNPLDPCNYTGSTNTTPSTTWSDADCDGDGVTNGQELIDGTNPNDGCSYNPANVTLPRSTTWNNADCDGDGRTNGQEVTDGTNPLDPCSFAGAANTTPSTIWNSADCDGDGRTNGKEVTDGTNPLDPCNYTGSTNTTPSTTWNNADCDGDGRTNGKEIADGTNPLDPCNFGGTANTTPSTTWNNADCDGDGRTNGQEVTDGTNPLDPCSFAGTANTTPSTTWNNADCDGDGVLNGVDNCPLVVGVLANNGCPLVITDTDGDGVTDAQELIDGTNPNDGCSYNPASVTLPRSTTWNNADCDGDGRTNGKEVTDGTNPLDPCSFAGAANTTTSTTWNNADCDGDGRTNGKEVTDGTNPLDPCSFTGTANTTPSTTWNNADCDEDGRTNGKEVTDGTNPLDPCNFAGTANTTPSTTWNNADCDGDGRTNGKEVTDGTNPLDPCSFNGSANTTPSTTWNNADCDGDGVINVVDNCPLVAGSSLNSGCPLVCLAGNTAPCLTTSYVCVTAPVTTYDLTTIGLTCAKPANTILTWHTGNPASALNVVTNPTAVATGSYWAAYKDTINNCFSNNGYATQNVTVSTCSVTGGGGGGIESKTLGNVISQRLYGKAVSNQSQDLAIPTQGFTKSTAVVNGPADLKLSDLVPASVAGTDRALISSPTDLVNFTNALEVLSVDYTRSNINKAVAFGTRTAGDVYSHTKPICDRLRGAELLEVKTLNINGYNVMAYQIRQRTGELEYAMNLNAGVKVGRSSISVQSNWFTDSYVRDETMFNFQLWAVSYEMVGNMAKDIITKLQQTGTVQAVTNSDLPVAYVSKGNRAGTKVNVTVQNNTSNTTGYFEIREKQNEGSVETVRTVPFTVGANKATTIDIPVQDYYEGSMYMYVGGKLTDLLYLSDGTWSLDYNKNNTTISKFQVENEINPQEQAGEYRLMRNVTVQGTSKDYITVYKTMNGGGIEQNLSNYKGIKFTTDATGLGQLNITIVKKGIQNWSDQYSYTINLDGSSKEYAIGLNQFRSSRTPSTPINANDVLAVNFGYNNTRGGNTAASINLSKVRFTTVDVAAQQALQSKTVSIYPNPIQTGVFTASFTSEQEQAVVLRVVEVATGKTVKLQFVEAKKGKNQVQVQLDKATNNGMYSVQVQGDNGNYESQKVMVNRK